MPCTFLNDLFCTNERPSFAYWKSNKTSVIRKFGHQVFNEHSADKVILSISITGTLQIRGAFRLEIGTTCKQYGGENKWSKFPM